MATVAYVADPKFILSQTSLFSGKLRAVEIPRERAIDLDSLYDFELAEFLMKRKMENLQ
jgi:N-acylneuraminate cytidylyltransferase